MSTDGKNRYEITMRTIAIILAGGAGTDVACYAASSAAVDVNLATGVGSGGHAAGDVLEEIEKIGAEYLSDMTTHPNGTPFDGIDEKLRAAFESDRWLTYDL